MSFLSKLKTVANQAKHASTSLGSNSACSLWEKYGDRICAAVFTCTSQAATKGSTLIADDDRYKAHVVDPAWEMLPTPVRLLGRERLKWDSIFNSARKKVFVIDGENVAVHPEAKQRINQMFARMLPNEQLQEIEVESHALDTHQAPTDPLP